MNGIFHPGDRMTSRQRLLAAYAGQEIDRLPYWAKVTNNTWRTSQPQQVRDWSDLELLDYIHADGLFGCPGVVRVSQPHVTTETRTDDNRRKPLVRSAAAGDPRPSARPGPVEPAAPPPVAPAGNPYGRLVRLPPVDTGTLPIALLPPRSLNRR